MSLISSAADYLGVDIGSTSVKIVNLKKEAGKTRLVNYGFSESLSPSGNDSAKSIRDAAKTINDICRKANISCRNAVSALPTFSVFTSIINLFNVNKKDISSAIHWEAKKVIPLPIEEMILDWKLIEGDSKENKKESGQKVLLTGAPKSLVKRYVDIFKEAKINLLSLETETFSLVRSLMGNDKSTVMLVEIGAVTTDVSIIDKGIPMLNRSIDVGGVAITETICDRLSVSTAEAEQFKYDLGVSAIDAENNEVPKAIEETIMPIMNEIKYATNLFQSKNDKKAEKIILSGGSALLPNLSNYLSVVLNAKVIIGDPWARVSYPLDLKPMLAEIGPRMSVAVGLALREME